MTTLTRVLLLVAVLVAGCKGRSSEVSGPATRPSGGAGGVVRTATLGYGLPSTWARQSPAHFAALLADHGLGLTVIELLDDTTGQPPPWPTIRAFLDAMRARQIATHVFLVNWNCRGTATPCPAVGEVGEWTRRLAELGTVGVTVEVAEPRDGDVPAIRAAREAWPGLFAVNWGFPGSTSVAYDIRSIHQCSPDPATWPRGADILHVTDCHGSLTQNARGIAQWTKATGGDAGVILFDWRSPAPDLAVLRELRDG